MRCVPSMISEERFPGRARDGAFLSGLLFFSLLVCLDVSTFYLLLALSLLGHWAVVKVGDVQ